MPTKLSADKLAERVARDELIQAIADQLALGKPTPFAFEGMIRHGLRRSDACMAGDGQRPMRMLSF